MKQIKGSNYYCDSFGNIYNLHNKKIIPNTSGKYPVVRLTVNGIRKEYSVLRLIWETYVGEIPPGHRVIRKYDKSASLHNLQLISLQDLGKKTGYKGNSKEVALFKNGEFVKKWRSSRNCAKNLFCSYQTVCDICNGKVKKPLYDLRWYK